MEAQGTFVSGNILCCREMSLQRSATMEHGERLVMGSGPANPYPEAMEAFGRPVLGEILD
jgi:hypothetical protein